MMQYYKSYAYSVGSLLFSISIAQSFNEFVGWVGAFLILWAFIKSFEKD